jgi:hypothetical protein
MSRITVYDEANIKVFEVGKGLNAETTAQQIVERLGGTVTAFVDASEFPAGYVFGKEKPLKMEDLSFGDIDSIPDEGPELTS